MDRHTARKDDTKLVGIFRNSKLFVQSVKKTKVPQNEALIHKCSVMFKFVQTGLLAHAISIQC